MLKWCENKDIEIQETCFQVELGVAGLVAMWCCGSKADLFRSEQSKGWILWLSPSLESFAVISPFVCLNYSPCLVSDFVYHLSNSFSPVPSLGSRCGTHLGIWRWEGRERDKRNPFNQADRYPLFFLGWKTNLQPCMKILTCEFVGWG